MQLSHESEPTEPTSESLPANDRTNGPHTWPILVWLVAVTVLALWVAVGHLSTYRGGQLRHSARVWDVWRNIRHDLPLPGVATTVLLLFTFACCGWLLWLTLTFTGETVAIRCLAPPRWTVIGIIAAGIVAVALIQWSDPRDDVTAGQLLNQTGLEPTMVPTNCAEFIDRAAEFRSGNLAEAQAERTAATGCRQAIATLWPTRSRSWPTQTVIWSTVEAAAR